MSHICDTNLSSHHHHHHHHQRAAPVAVIRPLVNAHAWAKPGRARRLTAAQRRHPPPLPRHHMTQPNDAAHRQPRHHVTIQLQPPSTPPISNHTATSPPSNAPPATPIPCHITAHINAHSCHITAHMDMHSRHVTAAAGAPNAATSTTHATSPSKGSSRRVGKKGQMAGTRREEEEGKRDDVRVVPLEFLSTTGERMAPTPVVPAASLRGGSMKSTRCPL